MTGSDLHVAVVVFVAAVSGWFFGYNQGVAEGQRMCPAESIGLKHHDASQQGMVLVCNYPWPLMHTGQNTDPLKHKAPGTR
jgi:hypothetical protein